MNTYKSHKKLPKVLPLGYIYISTDEGKIIVPDPKKADLVILAFQMAGKGKSFRTILKTLTEQGLTSNRGNPLSLSSLHNTLTNPFYAGSLGVDIHVRSNTYETLVSKKLFRQVQTSLQRQRCVR